MSNKPSLAVGIAAVATAVALVAQSANAVQCPLDETDFRSLRLSPSHLNDQAQVDALAESKLPLLCDTRAFWRRVRANGNEISDAEWKANVSTWYLSPAEAELYRKVVDAHLEAILKKMPQEQWLKLKRRILEEANVNTR